MIQLTRIDYRLIHGQVAFAWTTFLNADCILIANDDVVVNEMRKSALKLAKPTGVKLVFKSIEDSIAAINAGKTDSYKLFIVVEKVEDALRLAKGCKAIDHINVGLINKTENAKMLAKAVYANEQQCADLRALCDLGIRVELRQAPSDSALDVLQVL